MHQSSIAQKIKCHTSFQHTFLLASKNGSIVVSKAIDFPVGIQKSEWSTGSFHGPWKSGM